VYSTAADQRKAGAAAVRNEAEWETDLSYRIRQLRLSSAAWADFDQTIKLRIIPFNPLSQNIFLGIVLASVNTLVLTCLDGLPMADDSLHVAVFLRLGRVHNSHRR
jgi:hypothetical protein